jgi:hypothetical protein
MRMYMYVSQVRVCMYVCLDTAGEVESDRYVHVYVFVSGVYIYIYVCVCMFRHCGRSGER